MVSTIAAPPKRKANGRANSKKSAPISEILEIQQPLFEVDSIGSSSVRHTLLHQATSSNPASGRLRRGSSFNKPLKSDQILAARSNTPALTGRVKPTALVVSRKDKEKMGIVDRATKERLLRIAGRDGRGTGLWQIKSGGDHPEALTKAVREAGGYDAWEKKVRVAKAGDDLEEEAVLKANTTRNVPKVSFLFSLFIHLCNGSLWVGKLI